MIKKLFAATIICCLIATGTTAVFAQTIIDHTAVELYDSIPDQYRDEVKKMLVNIPGESHSRAYIFGLALLSLNDPRAPAIVSDNGLIPYTDQALRFSNTLANGEDVGEEIWYTNEAERQTITGHLDTTEAGGYNLALFGFGWCWDMTQNNAPGGFVDPVYGVRWAGSSVGGPDGDLRWGLDDGDEGLTGNSISMDTYLEATQEYADHAASQGHTAKVMFTTGPVDGGDNLGESGYQRYLKHEHIRNYVQARSDAILFDYADILTHNDQNQLHTRIWNGHNFPFVHPENMLDLDGNYAEDGDHIGRVGAVRLAKALWVLLAIQAGWDPFGPSILYGDISLNGSISALDASMAAQYAVGLIQLTPEQLLVGDVTGDGTVSPADASWIARKVVDPTLVFPVEGG